MTEFSRGTFLKLAGTSLAGLLATPAADAVTPDRAAPGRHRYTMAVLTNAKPGREDEFNDWYSNRHVHDVVKVPGFIAAQRFLLTETSGLPAAKYKYFAMYDMETADLRESIAELLRRIGTPALPTSEAMDPDAYYAVYEAITPRVTS